MVLYWGCPQLTRPTLTSDDMSHSITVQCPREECEAEFDLSVIINPGEPAKLTGPWEDCYPGSEPTVELEQREPEVCPVCKVTYNKQDVMLLHNGIEDAIDEFDWKKAAQDSYDPPEADDGL